MFQNPRARDLRFEIFILDFRLHLPYGYRQYGLTVEFGQSQCFEIRNPIVNEWIASDWIWIWFPVQMEEWTPRHRAHRLSHVRCRSARSDPVRRKPRILQTVVPAAALDQRTMPLQLVGYLCR